MLAAELLAEQMQDKSLKELWQKTETTVQEVIVENLCQFEVQDQSIYRMSMRRKHNMVWEKRKPLVILRKYKLQVFQIANKTPTSAHLGINKTRDRV